MTRNAQENSDVPPGERAVHGPQAPSPWISRFAGLVPPRGPVLDLACGGGRHGRLFLEAGHPVTFVDRDLEALADLSRRQDIEPDVELVRAELEDGGRFPMAGRVFAGVVVSNYLHRPLLARIVACVAPGGLLLYETFAVGNERFGKPSNPHFLLRPGELLEAVRGHLRVIAYEDVVEETPKPAARQRIAACRECETPGRGSGSSR